MTIKQRPPIIQRHKRLYFDVTLDPKTNQWYAEVFGRDGKTIHITADWPTRADAVKSAKDYIEGKDAK